MIHDTTFHLIHFSRRGFIAKHVWKCAVGGGVLVLSLCALKTSFGGEVAAAPSFSVRFEKTIVNDVRSRCCGS